MSPRRRRALAVSAALCAAGAVASVSAPRPAAQTVPAVAQDLSAVAPSAQVQRGRELFVDGCSACHGIDARGVPGQGPSLVGAGAQAADFYLSTGRMPLADPRDQPLRNPPAYPNQDIDALVAYVGSLGGPPVPTVDPARGSLPEGLRAFTEHCAGCHQVVAKGGIVTGAVAPPLQSASPREIAEAVRIGPYVMPRFPASQIDQRTLDSIARYVALTGSPVNRGGWGIGQIGPIPEGLVAWLLAGVALLIVARLIGERTSP